MSNPIARILTITAVDKHPNADSLDLVQLNNGLLVIVKRDEYKVGEKAIYIYPDSVLPDVEWAQFYRARSSRVKTIKLRGIYSQGIVEKFDKLGYTGPIEQDRDVHEELGIIHYEPPPPKDIKAKGGLPHGISKTDETNYYNERYLPFGEVCDITLKIDGTSTTFYYKDGETGICSRTLNLKTDVENHYTYIEKKYGILAKLKAFCEENKVNLAIRGEIYGAGIQGYKVNPHSKLPINIAFFSTYLIDSYKHARRDDEHYIFNLAPKLGLPTVDIIEKGAVLDADHIIKYKESLEKLKGVPFEGVVVNTNNNSFKIINSYYDLNK